MNFKKALSALCSAALCFAFTACNDRMDKPNKGDGPQGGDKPGSGQTNTDTEIPDDNKVDVTNPDKTEHDFDLVSQNGGTFTFKCGDCDAEESFTVSCESGTADAYSLSGNTLTFANITEKSVYDIKGNFHGNIVIDVTDDHKFELQMSGFELSSHAACPITVSSGDKVTLSAKKSTVNYIYDMRAAVDSTDETAVSASVYALCDLDIQGKGSLTVRSVNNNGIHTKDDLKVKNLELQVDCMDNALKGNDSVTVESGNIVLISRRGDGIKTTNSDVSSKGNQRGTVDITGGDILIYAACDGIDAAYDANVGESEGVTTTLQIFTDKYSKYSEEVTDVADSVYYVRYTSTSYKYSLKFYNDDSDAVWQNSSSYKTVSSGRSNYYYYSMTKPSGYAYVQLYVYSNAQQQGQSEDYVYRSGNLAVNNNYDTIALQSRNGSYSTSWTNYTTTGQGGFNPGGGFGPGGMNDGNTDKGDYSTKGIKAANVVAISGGTITISAYDDAIHANNDVVLEHGSTPSGGVLISGGSITLRSNDDGIHADGSVEIAGGSITVVSSYEGIEGKSIEIADGNISVVSTDDGINGTATSGTTIAVLGGELYVYAGGDGVDSNSQTSYAGIAFAGGRCVIISTGNSDSSIDTERGYDFSGGYVIGIGRSGGMGSEATNCSNFSSMGTSKTVNLQKDGYLIVDGIVAVKMPVAMNSLVVCLGKLGANISSATSASYDVDKNGVYWIVE